MQPFDLPTAPLNDVVLIEAGAGTGKTYTLTGLFLRLIVERGLGIDRILAVTYTKAATEELKGRIRAALAAARAAFADETPRDELTAMLLRRVADRGRALHRIQDALTDFDRAAIFTIHGFCQRLLQTFAFETGHLFHSELVQNSQPLVQELADDFWRRYISSAPYEFAHYAHVKLKGPEELARLLVRRPHPGVRIVPETGKPLLRDIAPFRSAAAAWCRLWRREKERIVDLLNDPVLNARLYRKCTPDRDTSPRRKFVDGLADRMDRWNGRYPLFPEAQRFAQAFLERATKKNGQTPRHPFFQGADRLLELQTKVETEMADYLRYLKLRLLRRSRPALDRKKQRHNIRFFDDLLVQVHHALGQEHAGELIRAVRRQYQAALVDEFQDTDPLQYDIFRRLFGPRDHTWFMIGDPKQAIYSFRGADIYSYLRAAETAPRRYTLTRNWRSTPGLIRAVNTLFSGRTRPFVFQRIAFQPAEPARGDGEAEDASLHIWHLTDPGEPPSTKPVSIEKALPLIAAGVAEEIVRLTSHPGTAVQARDIAVLTRTHRQSQIVKQALAARQVPAVLHSAGSVFHTPEAWELNQVLAALAAPEDHGRLKAALAGGLFEVGAAEFQQAQEGEPGARFQARWNAFFNDHQVWVRHGFYPMFRSLLDRESVKARLLARVDGERALTNLLHLAELLHQAEVESHLGPDGLVKWFTAQRQGPDTGGDEQQMRLESDSLAVRIITMHKSKGLQFDVVFCPFTWGGVRVDDQAAVFHDPRADDRLTLAIGPGIDARQLHQAGKELLAENLRMLYVALTRARRRCYLVWGRINRTEFSAPAFIFHDNGPVDDGGEWMHRLRDRISGLTDEDLLRDLAALAQRSGGTIAVTSPPRTTSRNYPRRVAPTETLTCRRQTRAITRQWRITSFSALVVGQAHEIPDPSDRDGGDLQPAPPGSPIHRPDLFGFPKGVRAGLFFHDLLEHWDPREDDPRRRSALVAQKLLAHGFESIWQVPVEENLRRLAGAVLDAGEVRFRLSQVPADGRINEMEFHYPLKPITPRELRSVFEPFVPAGRAGEIMTGRLERLVFEPVQGFLKGYIDAVIRFEDRYFLVDWKSNHLGDHTADYRPDRLRQTMAAADYFLQSHLYAVALDLLLQRQMADYDFGRHFGGVFYIFLRGVGADPGGKTGIYFDRPEAALIRNLEKVMIASS